MKPSSSSMWRHVVIAGIVICFLAFVGGAFIAEFRVFPYSLIFEDAFSYLKAVEEREATEAEATAEGESIAVEGKLTVPAGPEAFDGYTFLTFDTGRPSTARLVDMQGKIVHEWHRGLREIWPDTPQRPGGKASPDTAIAWRYAEMLPNGDVVATVKSMGDTPDGYGLIKIDKDSKVIWSLPDGFNHHMSITEDGRIIGMVHEWRNTRQRPVPGASYFPQRVLEDFIVEVSPEGKIISKVSLLDAIAEPEFRDLMGSAFFRNYSTKTWDRLHPNDIEIIDAAFASHHPFMKPGMFLISLRDLDALVLFDPVAKKVTWAMRGPWLRQHDPDLLANGNILLFDNRGDDIAGRGSRILEFDPSSGRVLWSYMGTKTQPFRSDKAGGQERLPNGNTLISEDDRGRIFEVTRDGKIVWEYRDVRVHHASRVAKDWIKFTPSAPTLATSSDQTQAR